MSLQVAFANKSNYLQVVCELIESNFAIEKDNVLLNFKYFNELIIEDVGIFIEFPYVDKHYRDVYYSYYSTKHRSYPRDTIRLSFFSKEIKNENFRNVDEFEKLKERFLGFLTLRPTKGNIFGRSVLSPTLYKKTNFVCCLAKYEVLVNGVKLKVHGFPYCAQDGERMSCAETTVLNIMEYFGVKYNEYSPTLPSKIINKLSNISFERLTPSDGLNTEDISYVLKEFGFSTKVYHKDDFAKNGIKFQEIVNSYVESGIPVIATLKNKNLGHAIIIIGRETFNKEKTIIHRFLELFNSPSSFSECVENYLIIDDNLPPYQLVSFNNPTNDSKYYHDTSFKDCTIESVVVPLYHKVYVDVVIVNDLIKRILNEQKLIRTDNKCIIKNFLASSRSFKSEVCLNKDLDPSIKQLIVTKRMPKFIWIAELYKDAENILVNNVMSLIVLDATEPNSKENHIIFIIHENQYIVYNYAEKIYEKLIADSIKLNTFDHNLKGIHCKWHS